MGGGCGGCCRSDPVGTDLLRVAMDVLELLGEGVLARLGVCWKERVAMLVFGRSVNSQ